MFAEFQTSFKMSGEKLSSVRLDIVQRVESAISNRADLQAVRSALTEFRKYRESLGLDFPEFPVITDPAIDNNYRNIEQSSAFDHSARCLAKVQTVASEETEIVVDMKVRPRIMQFKIIRPWLSDQLVNNIHSQSGRYQEIAKKYFDRDGGLRVIPSHIWVLMPELIEFQSSSGSSDDKLLSYISEGKCCRLVCEREVFDLSNITSLVSGRKEKFQATRRGLDPVVFAIVSRKREN